MNIKKIAFTALVAASIMGMAGCQKDDGVPPVKDYQHPLDANGKAISPANFYKKYCQGMDGNQTCSKILSVVETSNTRGNYPKGW